MNPPARPIRTELSEAVVGGIRQRGAEAVGLVIMGLARLLVTFAALLILLFGSSVLGLKVTSIPLVFPGI